MVIEGHAMETHKVDAEIQQVSPVSPILFTLYTSWLKNRAEGRVF